MFDHGGTAGKVAQIHALLAEVAVSISADMSGPAAYEAMAEAIPAAGQLDLVLCLLAERMDRSGEFAADNATSMGSWMRNQAHSSHKWSTERVNAGRALVDQLPFTRAAWERGELTLEHVTVIRHAVDGLEPEFVASLDQALASAAATPLSPKELQDVAAALLEEFVPEKQEKDRQAKTSGIRAHLSDTPDGARLDADLDAEGAAILKAALDKFMPKPEPGVLFSHRRAQGLIEMARQALDFGTGHEGSANKPHLIITISEEKLLAELGVGYLPDGTPIAASMVRKLACDAKIIPLMYGADSMPVDIGRTSRVVSPAQHIALNNRDGGCTTPGCEAPPSWCDAHHVLSWLDGGLTDLINLVLLCRKHHTMVHQGKLRIEALGNQRFRFTNLTDQLRQSQPRT